MSEPTAREILGKLHALYGGQIDPSEDEFSREVQVIADALAQARREEREAACQEIAEFNGITAEQTEALCKAIRQREGA